MTSRLSNISDDTLAVMLQEYAEKLRLSYSLTWATASVFLPVSLAGIAVYDVKDREWTVTLVSIASVGLIWLWYFIALRFRAFADHDKLIYHEIELEVLSRQKAGFESFDSLYSQGTNLSIKSLRNLIPVSVSAFWFISVIAAWLL
jgi:hypothetical protein